MLDTAASSPRQLDWAGLAIGFGLAGFFDGILLHQILQWHHLLSGLEQARHDIRVLIIADGLFHLLMYAVAAIGLWLLWRSRVAFAAPGGDKRVLIASLIGFGGWHILDALLSHWLLGIHRIRMDVDDPLAWDVLWLAVFGLLPLAASLFIRRNNGGSSRRLLTSPITLMIAVALAGGVASLPPPGDTVVVLFRPGISAQQIFNTMRAVGGRVAWTDASQQLWVIKLEHGGSATEFYVHGAILVSQGLVPAGCLNWLQSEPVSNSDRRA